MSQELLNPSNERKAILSAEHLTRSTALTADERAAVFPELTKAAELPVITERIQSTKFRAHIMEEILVVVRVIPVGARLLVRIVAPREEFRKSLSPQELRHLDETQSQQHEGCEDQFR